MPEENTPQEETPQKQAASEDMSSPSPDLDLNEEQEIEDKGSENIPSVDEIRKTKKKLEASTSQNTSPSEPSQKTVSASEARNWAMLAHLSILLNMVSGVLGLVAAIIIYFVYKDRSRFVAYHAMQSFIFQAITWIGVVLVASILITVGGALAFLIIPLLCLFGGLLLLMLVPASLIYGIVGAGKVNNGEDFRYWQVGDWVRDILEPKTLS
jgi:hypothetical protein